MLKQTKWFRHSARKRPIQLSEYSGTEHAILGYQEPEPGIVA